MFGFHKAHLPFVGQNSPPTFALNVFVASSSMDRAAALVRLSDDSQVYGKSGKFGDLFRGSLAVILKRKMRKFVH